MSAQHSFEEVVFKTLAAYHDENNTDINALTTPLFPIAILYRRGAFDNISFTDSIHFQHPIPEYLSYRHGRVKWTLQIKYESFPVFSCDSETWNKKPGIFCDTLHVYSSRSTMMILEKNYELHDKSHEHIRQIQAVEKMSRKIIVVGEEQQTLIFFLSNLNENWFLIGIDRFEACSA